MMSRAKLRSPRVVATLVSLLAITLSCVATAGWIAGTPAPTVQQLAQVSTGFSEAECRLSAKELGFIAGAGSNPLVLTKPPAPMREAALETEILLRHCLGYEPAKLCFGDSCVQGKAGILVELKPREVQEGEG